MSSSSSHIIIFPFGLILLKKVWLTECIGLKPIRQKYYQTTNLKQIFYQINPKKLLGYTKEVHIYNKILRFLQKICFKKYY